MRIENSVKEHSDAIGDIYIHYINKWHGVSKFQKLQEVA